MRSSHTSPSIRTVARMHARGSYFASPPSSPNATTSAQYSPSRGSYFSTTPSSTTQASHPAGALSPVTAGTYGFSASPCSSPRLFGQCESPRPNPTRRPTMTSAIPLSPQHAARPQSPDARRRPSFKIELPPRPAPTELLADISSAPAGHTPYAVALTEEPETKITPHDERGAGRKLSTGALDMTDMRAEIDSIAYRAHLVGPSPSVRSAAPPTSFSNPFAPAFSSNASPRRAGSVRLDIRPAVASRVTSSPGGQKEDGSIAGVGLGYSLNRMRVPTPWARRQEEEGEWLNDDDVSRATEHART